MEKMRFKKWTSLFVLLILVAQSEGASGKEKDSEVVGTYFNEDRVLLELNLISKDGRDISIIPIEPGRIDRAVISEGLTKLYIPSEEMATRRLLSTSPTATLKSAPEFCERETGTFYFRVIHGEVILVKPKDLTATERKRLQAYNRALQRAGVYHNR